MWKVVINKQIITYEYNLIYNTYFIRFIYHPKVSYKAQKKVQDITKVLMWNIVIIYNVW